MKKSTVYGLATLCGAGSLFFGYVVVFCGASSPHPPEIRADSDFVVIGNAIKTYQINAGRPPTTAQGLDALVNKPTQGPTPRRWVQVMRKYPRDPWLTPHRYALLSPKEYEWRWELRSAGPDGFFGSGDDFTAEFESGRNVASIPQEAEVGVDSRPSF
ncbi:MAG TPA: type II secretion system protein GspG [Haloferula sp.]